MGYQCSQKNNLHIRMEEDEEEEDNTTNKNNDISLDNDDLADNDYRVDVSLMFVVRRILVRPKVDEEDWCHTFIF